MFECLEREGLSVVDVGIDWNGLIYDYSIIAESGDEARMDGCYRDNAEPVDMAWQLSVSPIREAIEAEVLECLGQSGLEIPEGVPAHANALRHLAPEGAWDGCLAEVRLRDDAAGLLLSPLSWDS